MDLVDQLTLYTDEVPLNITAVSKWPSRRWTDSLRKRRSSIFLPLSRDESLPSLPLKDSSWRSRWQDTSVKCCKEHFCSFETFHFVLNFSSVSSFIYRSKCRKSSLHRKCFAQDSLFLCDACKLFIFFRIILISKCNRP